MSQNTGPENTVAVALSPRQERAIQARDNMETGGKPAPLVPKNFIEAQAFAVALAESPLMPAELRKAASNVLVVILAGIELGLTPMTSIRLHHVINGVPRLSSAGIGAIVLASPLCEYLRCTESTETRSTWATKRRGEPEKSCTWTKERAVTAKLWGSGTWEKYPTGMLNARARKEVCEMVYPDICAGLLSAEEAEDLALEKERPAAPVFVTPPTGTPPGVPSVEQPPKRGPGRPPKDKSAPIDAQSTERPTSGGGSTGSAATQTSSSPPAPSAGVTETSRDRWGQPIGDPTNTSSSSPVSSSASPTPAQSETKASTSSAPPPASESQPAAAESSQPAQLDGFEDEPDSGPEFTLEKFYAWLAEPKATQDQLVREAAPWVAWTGRAFKEGDADLIKIRKAYKERKQGLPA